MAGPRPSVRSLLPPTQDEIKLLVSALMPIEVLGGPTRSRTQQHEEAAEAIVTRSSNIVVPAGRNVVLRARRYRLEHGLKTMDALHLASAVRGYADVFFTWNMDDFDRLGSEVAGVKISEPYWYGTPQLEGFNLPTS